MAETVRSLQELAQEHLSTSFEAFLIKHLVRRICDVTLKLVLNQEVSDPRLDQFLDGFQRDVGRKRIFATARTRQRCIVSFASTAGEADVVVRSIIVENVFRRI